MNSPSPAPDGSAFTIDDSVNAWVPHGRFMRAGAAGGPLAGLRFAAKDLFDVAGHVTGAGNPTWLATHAPAEATSPTVQALLDAGATLAGKVLTDELAYSLHGDNHHYGVWGLRSTHGLLPARGLVPLSPGFDTPTWLADDGGVFERVADVLLPASDWQPKRLLWPADAWAMADAEFQAPGALAMARLSALLGTEVQRGDVAEGDDLGRWRQHYSTCSAHQAWQEHGAWITAQQPVFGAAIAGRWSAASRVGAEEAARAQAEVQAIRQRVRAWLGDDGVALLPSAASLAPRRDADPADVDAVRMRMRTSTMAITCIAGTTGLPQVSLPWPGDTEAPIGLSLLGPPGSDRALVRLARRLWLALA